jgi:tryptophan 2,3-dioxygenase
MSDYGQNPRLSYSDYLRVPELLQLQHPLAEPAAHDELQFIVVHQVYELWFRLVLHELDAVKAAIDAGAETDDDAPLRTAIRLLKRVETIFKVLVQQIHVLESMRPVDFLDFRSQLNPASGFQSAQFREVECLLGLKDEALVRRVENDPRIAALRARLEGDTIPDALYRLLRGRGFHVTPPDSHRTEAQARTTLEVLRLIYEQPDEHDALYALCEALVDLDEQLVLWRRHHIMMVERQIGSKAGTGKGTTGELDGIRYLLSTLGRQLVPDLWAVRTVLET